MSTQILNVFPGLALGILTATGTIQVWHVNMLSLLTSSLQVLSGPARQALVPSLVPTSHLMNAITLTTIMQQGTQLIAPLLAGYLIDFAGVKVSYFVDATLLLPALISILMLRTTGRKTGRQRTVALLYHRDESGYVVVGSKGGSDTPPAWLLNLEAAPQVEVQIGTKRFAANARLASDSERRRIWPEMTRIWPQYDRYQAQTRRVIPLVILVAIAT